MFVNDKFKSRDEDVQVYWGGGGGLKSKNEI